MKLIALTGKYGMGKFTMVDDENYQMLNSRKWYAHKDVGGSLYAVRSYGKRPCKRQIMSRVIMGATNKYQIVDHINHDTLDNRKENLRLCTIAQNIRNGVSRKNSTSKFLGVYLNKIKRHLKNGEISLKQRWVAKIRCNGKSKQLASFPFTEHGEVLAAKAYDKAAKEYYGEFANLNFKE